MLAFLSYYKPADFVANNTWIAPLIYSASIALVTPVIFLVFKVYKIITKDIGIFECIRIVVITFLIQVIGLIVISFVCSLVVSP